MGADQALLSKNDGALCRSIESDTHLKRVSNKVSRVSMFGWNKNLNSEPLSFLKHIFESARSCLSIIKGFSDINRQFHLVYLAHLNSFYVYDLSQRTQVQNWIHGETIKDHKVAIVVKRITFCSLAPFRWNKSKGETALLGCKIK